MALGVEFQFNYEKVSPSLWTGRQAGSCSVGVLLSHFPSHSSSSPIAGCQSVRTISRDSESLSSVIKVHCLTGNRIRVSKLKDEPDDDDVDRVTNLPGSCQGIWLVADLVRIRRIIQNNNRTDFHVQILQPSPWDLVAVAVAVAGVSKLIYIVSQSMLLLLFNRPPPHNPLLKVFGLSHLMCIACIE